VVAPSGLEPELLLYRVRRVASYTTEQFGGCKYKKSP
jgi:hypothetical protein